MSEEDIKADLVRDRGEISRKNADEQIDAALAEPNFDPRAAKKARTRKIIKWFSIALGGGFLVLILYSLFTPYTSTMAYGICRVFLERQIAYPQSVHISSVEEFESSVRIWFAQINTFGEYRLEQIQCYLRQDPVTGAALERVAINRRDVDPKIVEAFNKTLTAILAHPPDLTVPEPLPDKLEDLTIETDKFRRPLL